MASPSYDTVAVVLGSSALREPETVGKPLREVAAASEKPIVGFVSPDAPQLVRQLNLAGVPTFAAPESCVAALAAMRRLSEARDEAIDEAIDIEPPGAPATAEVAHDVHALLKPGALNEAESKRLFARFGIPVTREIIAGTATEAQAAAQTFDRNVVLKILSRDVLHKSEAGGVVVGVAPADVPGICAEMVKRFHEATRHAPEGLLVQELVSDGVELILGFHHDPQLGHAVLLGMGGVTAELYRDTSLRLAPVSRRDATEMIDDLTSAPLLKGFRGRPLADVAALVDAIVAFSDMIGAIGDELQEAEINPLFVRPQGRGVVAADGVVVVRNLKNAMTSETGI